jgi:DNA-binding beta-propeller fold protein YncE
MEQVARSEREKASRRRKLRVALVVSATLVIAALAVFAFAASGPVSARASGGSSSPRPTADLAGGSLTASTAAVSSVIAKCHVGDNPVGIAYDPLNHYVYVADNGPGGGTGGAITILKASCHVVATIALTSVSFTPYGVAYDPSTHNVLVSDDDYGYVFVLSGTSIVDVLTGFCSPQAMTWDAQADAMLVVDPCNAVDAIYGNTQQGVDTGAISSVCDASSVLDAAGYIWVTDECAPYTVDLFNPVTFALVGHFTISTEPQALAWDPVNDTVLVGSAFGNTMHVLDPASVALNTYINTTFPLGKLLGTGSILYSPTTHAIYVSDRAGSDVWKISSSGKVHHDFIASSADLEFMTYDVATTHIYVCGYNTNTVYQIQ